MNILEVKNLNIGFNMYDKLTEIENLLTNNNVNEALRYKKRRNTSNCRVIWKWQKSYGTCYSRNFT